LLSATRTGTDFFRFITVHPSLASKSTVSTNVNGSGARTPTFTSHQ
jgi:hypothetical protein